MSEELTFGSWLRRRRKELSITQEELAERSAREIDKKQVVYETMEGWAQLLRSPRRQSRPISRSC